MKDIGFICMSDKKSKSDAARAFNDARIRMSSTNSNTYQVIALDNEELTSLSGLEGPYNVCFKPRSPEYLINFPMPLTSVDQGIVTVMGSEYCGFCWGGHTTKSCPELAKGGQQCGFCGDINAHLARCCLRDEAVDRYRMGGFGFYEDWETAPL